MKFNSKLRIQNLKLLSLRVTKGSEAISLANLRAWGLLRLCLAMTILFCVLSFSGCGSKQDATQTVNVGDTGTSNTAPVISSVVASPPTTQTSGSITLTTNAVDADGDTLNYGWSTTGGTLQTSSGAQVSWTAPTTAGNYTISVLVTDGKNGQASANATVSVSAPQGSNQNPVIGSGPTASPTSVKTGASSTVSVSASDADGDSLSYTWSETCGSHTGSSASIIWTAGSSTASCTISVVVSDGKGGTAGGSTDITVTSSTSTNFSFIRKWGQKGTCATIDDCGDSDLYSPVGIALDKDGNVYVTNSSSSYENFIKKFSNAGTLLKIYGIKGTCSDNSCYGGTSTDGGFYRPVDVAVDSSGNLFVSDDDNNRIQKLDANGTLLTKWGTGYFGGYSGGYSPGSIILDKNGDVLVANSSDASLGNKILRFQSNGIYVTSIGSGGSGSGYLNLAYSGIAVDSQNNIYVADTRNNRVQVFSGTDGSYLRKWGSSGINPGQFSYPQGIAIDSSDNVYVVDNGNNRVQVFKSDGTFITSFGSKGSTDGLFDNPTDIAVDSGGVVYVVDTGNNRIQVFAAQ